MMKRAKDEGVFKSYGRRTLAFVLAIVTFVTSVNLDWSSLVVADAWTTTPIQQLFADGTVSDSYSTAIDLTNDGLTISANSTGQLGAVLSASQDYEYPKAVSFCVDVPGNASVTTSAIAYQNIKNANTVSNPSEIASNGVKMSETTSYTYANTTSDSQTVVMTIYMGDSKVRASAKSGETYGVVVNVSGTADLKYYTGTNGNSGNKYVNSINGDSERALVVSTGSSSEALSYRLDSSSWTGTKYMAVGDSATFNAYAVMSDGSGSIKRSITYSINDTSVASIDASTGVIIANAAGSATVTAKTDDGTSTTASIQVLDAVFDDGTKTKSVTYDPTTPIIPTVKINKSETETVSDISPVYPSVEEAKDVGTKTITIDGGSTYPGYSQTLYYNVTAKNIPNDDTLNTASSNGKILIDVGTDTLLSSSEITDGSYTMALGTDYTATVSNKQVLSDGTTIKYDVTFTGIGNYTGKSSAIEVSALNATTTNRLDISSLNVTVDDSNLIYKGTQYPIDSSTEGIMPLLKFTDDNDEPVSINAAPDNLKIEITSYSGGSTTGVIGAGTYTIKITGQDTGIYKNSISDVEFYVSPLQLSSTTDFILTSFNESDIKVIREADSDETKIRPTMVFHRGQTEGYTLEEGRDFEYSYTGEKKVGEATVSLEAVEGGNFSGKRTISYTIVPNLKRTSDFIIRLKSTLSMDSSGEFYNASSYTPKYTGKQYVGSVTDDSSTQTEVPLVVKDKTSGETLTKGTDYTVTVTGGYDNKNAGTASLTITYGNGTGTYKNVNGDDVENSVDVRFNIVPIEARTAYVVFDSAIDSLYYTGQEINADNYTDVFGTTGSQLFKVQYGATELVNGTDYVVSYFSDENNSDKAVDAGTAVMHITAKGNYTGDITGSFEIKRRSISAKDSDGNTVTAHNAADRKSDYGVAAVMNPARAESGELKKNYLDGEAVTLSYQNDTTNTDYDYSLNYVVDTASPDYTVNRLKLGTDFKLADVDGYINNRKVAKWTDTNAPTITLEGIGNYKGTRQMTFTIAPAKLYTLGLNVNSVPITNASQYVPYESTGSTDATRGSHVAVEYDGEKPMPTVEFTEKTLTEGTEGDYIRYYFDNYNEAISQANEFTLSDPSNTWTKDVNPETDTDGNQLDYGYKYLLIRGINNYAGDYKIIQFKVLRKNIALPSIEVQLTPSAKSDEAPTIEIYDKSLTDPTKRTVALTVYNGNNASGADYKLMMYDASGTLVAYSPDSSAGANKEIVIQGINNYESERTVVYRAGINLSAFSQTADTTNKKVDLTDETGIIPPEMDHYITLSTPVNNDEVVINDSGDTIYTIPYIGKTTRPTVKLYRVKQTGETTDTPIAESEYDVTFEAQGDSDGFSAGSIVKVTISASDTTTVYYGETSFYYDIKAASLSDVTFYDVKSLDYSATVSTDGGIKIKGGKLVYPYTGGEIPVFIKAMYGDEEISVKSVQANTTTDDGTTTTALSEGMIDTGIIDKVSTLTTGTATSESGDSSDRKIYTINNESYKLKVELDDDNFTGSITLPYYIRGIDFVNVASDTVSHPAADDVSVRIVDSEGNTVNPATAEYDYTSKKNDFTPKAMVKWYDESGNTKSYDINNATYSYKWVNSANTEIDDPIGADTYKVKLFAHVTTGTLINDYGRTAGNVVYDSPVLTITPRVADSDLEATLSATTFDYNAAEQGPTITIKDNGITVGGSPYELVEGTDYTLSGDKATMPGRYTPQVTFIGNYEGSSLTLDSYTIKGNFTNANTKTTTTSAVTSGPYYVAKVNDAIKDGNNKTILYLRDGKLYLDEACATEFTESLVKMYYYDSTSSDASDEITDCTVTFSSALKTPGVYTGSTSSDGYITVKGASGTYFEGSEVTITGFTVKADIAEAKLYDENDNTITDGKVFDYVYGGTSNKIADQIATVKWGSNTLEADKDYQSPISVSGATDNLGTPGEGTITLKAATNDSCLYFGSKTISFSVVMKLYGYDVRFDNGTVLSEGTPTIKRDDILTWTSTSPVAYMTTKDASGNAVQVDPKYYTVTISGTSDYTSTVKAGTMSKFVDGSNADVTAQEFVPGTYYISFAAKNGAQLDTSIASASPSFKVSAMEIKDCSSITGSGNTYTYNGAEIKPDELVSGFEVKDIKDKPLEKGTDYLVSYTNNVNAAKSTDTNAPTMTITGIGNYTGTLERTFTIEPKSISTATVTVPAQYYTGSKVYPISQVTVVDEGTTLTRNTDFTITNDDFTNNKDVTTATSKAKVKVHGTGNYTGEASGEFDINPLDFSKAGLVVADNECEYTGQRIYGEAPASATGKYRVIKPKSEDKDKDGVLKILIPNEEDPDNPTVLDPNMYTVQIDGADYVTNANESGYDVTITAKSNSNYEGTLSFKYYVHKKKLEPTVEWKEATSNVKDVDVTTPQTSTVTQYGENYSYSYEMTMKNADTPSQVSLDNKWTGSPIEPTISIKDDTWWTATGTSATGKTLVLNEDYTVVYTNNTNGASKDDPTIPPTVTITGTGNYTGEFTKTFNIGDDLSATASDGKPRFVMSVPDKDDDGNANKSLEYSGAAQLPAKVVVKDRGEDGTGNTLLTQGEDFTYDASTDKTNVGTHKLVVTGANNYYNSISFDDNTTQSEGYYEITPKIVDPDGDWTVTLNTSGASVTDAITRVVFANTETYKGSAWEPGMTITYTDGDGNVFTLDADTDYSIDYANNVNANMAKAGSGFTRKSPESIYPLASAQAKLKVDGNYQFEGYSAGDEQKLDKKTFAILPYNIETTGTLKVTDSDADQFPSLSVSDGYAIMAFDYDNHSAIDPAIKVTFSGTDAPADLTASATTADLKLDYSDDTDPGLATVKVTGQNNFYGTLNTNYHIVANVEKATVELDSTEIKPYTDGTVGYPVVRVKFVFDDETSLSISEGSDYVISAIKDGDLVNKGESPSNPDVWKSEGDATLVVSGVNPHFTGSNWTAYTYKSDGTEPDDGTPDFDESRIVVDTSTLTFTYDTKNHYPAVTTVYDTDGNLLTENTDYTVSYADSTGGNAKDVGSHTIIATIKGIGDYENADDVSVSTDIEITQKNIADTDVTFSSSSFVDVVYTGSAITPTTTIRYNGTTLTQNVDYTMTYINNIDPGTAIVRISGINNFYGKKSDIFFDIGTIPVTGLKVSSTSTNSVTLTWTRASKANGYTVSYMQDGKAKSVTTTGNTVTISGLSSKTTTSFAVRCYVTSSATSRTYYGDPSRVSATTK